MAYPPMMPGMMPPMMGAQNPAFPINAFPSAGLLTPGPGMLAPPFPGVGPMNITGAPGAPSPVPGGGVPPTAVLPGAAGAPSLGAPSGIGGLLGSAGFGNILSGVGRALMESGGVTPLPTTWGQTVGRGFQYADQLNQASQLNAYRQQALDMKTEEAAAKRQEREDKAAGVEKAQSIMELVGAGDMTRGEAAVALAGIPGYTGVGTQMMGLEQSAANAAATAADREARLGLDQMRLEEQERSNRAREGAAWANVAANRAKVAADVASTGRWDVSNVQSARDDLRADTKEARKGLDAWETINEISRNGQFSKMSAADDLAMITQFNKVLDPQSTVRESEFEAAGNTGGLDSRVQVYFDRWRSGEGLTPEMRANLYDTTRRVAGPYLEAVDTVNEQYADMARRGGANVSDVVVYRPSEGVRQSLAPPSAPTPTAAAPTASTPPPVSGSPTSATPALDAAMRLYGG